MDPRTNGHGDDDPRPSEPGHPRRRANDRRPSSAASLRAADQLARLEPRIRDFHHNLEPLDGAEADVDALTQRTAETSAAADSLIRRAAAAARLAAGAGQAPSPAGNGSSTDTPGPDDRPDPTSEDESPGRYFRADGRAEGPFSAQRRIDALRPEPRARERASLAPPAPDPAALARAVADRIREDAERAAAQLLQDAEREAAATRSETEQEMQHLWQAIETEIETIQTEISQRVDRLSARMEAAGSESEHILTTAIEEAEQLRAAAIEEADQLRAAAIEEAEQIRAAAFAEASQIRGDATEKAEELLALAEREAHALIAEARTHADLLLGDATEPVPAAAPERNTAERIAEQIRDATAALTRRVSRASEDAACAAREVRSPGAVPSSIREVLEGLGAAVSLIERSLAGLADLLDPFGSDHPDER